MSNQAHSLKCQRGGDLPHRNTRSHGQPRTTSTSTQAIDPIYPSDYNVVFQPLNEPITREGYIAADSMDWEYNSSEKLESNSSYTTSYLNADPSSDGGTNARGGYVMVQNPSSGAYSSGSGSNQTSEGFSEQGQQACYFPPWTPAAEFAVDTEAMNADRLTLTAHDQQWIVSDLGTQKSEPHHNFFQPHRAISSGVMYQEFPENYSLHRYYQTSATESSPSAPKPQDGPWNQTALRVPRYDSSFAAFGLSEPEVEESPSKSKTSQKKSSSRSPKLPPGPDRKDGAAGPGWEHIVVEKGGLRVIDEGKYDSGSHPSGGRRKGKLPKETKEKAARVRRVKACWNCWLLKVPCSEGEVCERCVTYCSRRSVQSPSTNQLCSRAGFVDFEETFFPKFLHSHLNRHEIKALIDGHSRGFIGESMQVEVSTGSAFTPLKLATYSFKPKHNLESELLRQHHLTVETEEQNSMFVCRYSAPVGLMALSTSDLKKALREHVESMISNAQYSTQTTAGDASQVAFLILEEVRGYYSKTHSPLVHSALKLHAMHYFMSTLVTFTAESAVNVYRRSPPLNVPPESFLSSRLLNRQLKFVMHLLQREVTQDVLEGLEKSMRSRTKDAWGPCFAAILVLCLCIEGLQTAADTFVVCEKIKEEDRSEYSREHSRVACEDVEQWPYEKCTMLFHEIFKTKKEGNGGSREGGFNPLRLVECELPTGLDSWTDLMVRSIFGWVRDSCDALQELSQRPALLDYGYDINPKDIKINNNGRLAAKFLLSFFAEDA